MYAEDSEIFCAPLLQSLYESLRDRSRANSKLQTAFHACQQLVGLQAAPKTLSCSSRRVRRLPNTPITRARHRLVDGQSTVRDKLRSSPRLALTTGDGAPILVGLLNLDLSSSWLISRDCTHGRVPRPLLRLLPRHHRRNRAKGIPTEPRAR